MKLSKKLLSLLLCTIMIFGSVAIGGDGFIEMLDLLSTKASAYSTGDYIYYGTYPQSEVTDSALVSALNGAGGSWKSYGYYSGTDDWGDGQMKPSDYMRYKDVSYNGSKYRAVTFDSYRPSYTGYTSSNNEQQSNGYYTGNVYWFKYEPIKWRVLDPSTGLIMCDTAIDSQAYNNFVYYNGSEEYGDSSCTYYASNYAKSSIRAWLNNDFYNTAFSSDQKSNIVSTTLDNSSIYSSAYDAPSTTDKIFLLSYNDPINSNYGFSSSWSADDTAHQLKSTDYAKCQGCYQETDNLYRGNCWWWLRSPFSSGSAHGIYSDGSIGYVYSVDGTNTGVVPALRLQNLKSDYAGSDDDGLNSYIKGFVSDLTVDYKSSVILHANFDNIKDENIIYIIWYVNGNVFAHGDSVMLNSLTEDSAVYCEGVDSNGKVYKSDVENIHVRTSFWIRLKAFFRSLFGLLPIIDQK